MAMPATNARAPLYSGMTTEDEQFAIAFYAAAFAFAVLAVGFFCWLVFRELPAYLELYKYKAAVSSTGGVISTSFIANYYGVASNDNTDLWKYLAEKMSYRDARKLRKGGDAFRAELRKNGYAAISEEDNPVVRAEMLKLWPDASCPFSIVAKEHFTMFGS